MAVEAEACRAAGRALSRVATIGVESVRCDESSPSPSRFLPAFWPDADALVPLFGRALSAPRRVVLDAG